MSTTPPPYPEQDPDSGQPSPYDPPASPYGQPPSPYGQPASPYDPPTESSPYGQTPPASPYGTPPASPYGTPPPSPYVSPYDQPQQGTPYATPYQSTGPYVTGASTSKNNLAVWGLVAGLVGLLCGITSIVGIILSVQARKAADQGLATNRGLATAALVVSIVVAILWVLGILVNSQT